MEPNPNTRHQTALTRMLNRLRRGESYRARTAAGESVTGEYLGTEVCHGDRAILLRDGTGTTSIPVVRLLFVVATA